MPPSPSNSQSIRKQSGQVQLIITLVVSVISLILGAAVTQRAVSNLRQSTYTAQAAKAQKFADAGAEHLLIADLDSEATNCPPPPSCGLDVDGDGDDGDVAYSVETIGNGPTVEATLTKDQTTQIDITNYAANTNIEIYWVKIGSGEDSAVETEAALIISLIYDEGGTTKLSKYAFDYNHVSRANENNFSTPSIGDYEIPAGSGNHYKYFATVKAPSGTTPKAVRIRPLYNTVQNSFVAKRTSTETFPTQGHKITSTGTYGESQWTVEVIKMNPALPAIFDYAIFTESDLTK